MIAVSECRYGTYIVRDNDMYVGKSLIELGEFCEGQAYLFKKLIGPEMTVIDVGANIGAHTVLFAQLAREVHAFEPQRQAFHMLCGNVAMNDLQNVKCYRQAVGLLPEKRRIGMLDQSVQNNIGAFSLDMEGQEDEVEVVQLEIPCDFIKIDVEGWELQVLEGAEPMIRECKPILYVENDKKDKSDALISKIREMGYTPYWHITPMFNENNARGRKENPWDNNVCSFDMLCVQNLKIEGLAEANVGDPR